MEPSNEWFATGSADRTIKVGAMDIKGLKLIKEVLAHVHVHAYQLWELASGRLKLTLTGHISTVRALVVSPRQPYLFSAGEDKQVKCWDLEYNKASYICVLAYKNYKNLKFCCWVIIIVYYSKIKVDFPCIYR